MPSQQSYGSATNLQTIADKNKAASIPPVSSAISDKLNTAIGQPVTPATLQPIQTPNYQAPATSSSVLKPVGQPTMQDFITEAQKLGTQSFQNQADILGQSDKALADQMARNLYSQNVGSASGVGQQVQLEAIRQRNEQLAPYAAQVATATAQQELQYQYADQQQKQQMLQNNMNLVLSGQLDKSQISTEDWANLGITDPTAINTVQQMDIRNQMISQGMDPNNPNDQTAYRVQLQNATKNNLKQQIIGWYSSANDGQVPTPDEVNMMMLYYGYGTGALTPEEQTQLVNQYNTTQWNDKLARAKEKATAEKGKVICTELYAQGKMSMDVFLSDRVFGMIQDEETMIGYHRWAKPLVELMKKSKVVTWLVALLALPWAQEMHFRVSGRGRSNSLGRLLMKIGIPLCRMIGRRELRYGYVR